MMGTVQTGATYGDAFVRLIDFAENDRWTFVLTVPLTLGLALVIAVVVLKVVVIGPLTNQRDKFNERRASKLSKVNEEEKDA